MCICIPKYVWQWRNKHDFHWFPTRPFDNRTDANGRQIFLLQRLCFFLFILRFLLPWDESHPRMHAPHRGRNIRFSWNEPANHLPWFGKGHFIPHQHILAGVLYFTQRQRRPHWLLELLTLGKEKVWQPWDKVIHTLFRHISWIHAGQTQSITVMYIYIWYDNNL